MSSLPLPQGPNTLHRSKRRLASMRTILALVLREMVTTYGRSPGGYLWAVLEPVAGIALLTIIFSAGFRSPALGISFPLFYASGMLPFLMYSDLSGKVSLSILFSKPLLAYPAVTYLDAILARFFVNLLTQLLVAYLVLFGILTFFDTKIVPDYPTVVLGFFMAACLALGVGTFNCYLFLRFPVWQRTWSILMRPLFIISCIFFLFDTIPQPYRDILWYNPIVHVVGLMRRGFYANYDAPYVSLIYVFGISMLCFLAGLTLLYRGHRRLVNDG
ncbi:ABC transporter permease [Sulfitobacter sp.]|uniref:ABC transporter permease n=1 Tax=Sulfitobacter sp. TaxID=1903071 RepID=UPI0032981CF9